MPLRFPVKDFFQPTVNTASEFSDNLRDSVATFACNLWSSFPGFVVDNTNPASSFARGFMNSMCSPIQSPVPMPDVPFLGGQCEDIAYDITVNFDRTFIGNTTNITETTVTYGSIRSIMIEVNPPDIGNITYIVARGNPGTLVPSGNGTISVGGVGFTAVINTITVVRRDGQPDTCGDIAPFYPGSPPTANNLNTIINITNNDGLALAVEIQYLKLSNEYNFPMLFQVNGNKVILDFGGLNFYAPDGLSKPGSDNNLPPPGTDGGDNGIGDTITKTYPENEYPIAPESPVPRVIDTVVQYVACTEGVVETLETTLQLAVGFNPILSLIIEILGQILTDLCETPEASLGLPEYYGLAPGADRPAILYLWKIYENDKWGASTYSSTVHHPTSGAIADIENLMSFEKTIGTFKTLIRLSDGSTIKATGGNEIQSQANFDFLINQVDSSFVPADINANTIREVDNRLNLTTLRLRQVEYYPNGKKDNSSPSIKRVIEPP